MYISSCNTAESRSLNEGIKTPNLGVEHSSQNKIRKHKTPFNMIW